MKRLLPVLVLALSVPAPAQAAEPGSGLASFGLSANAPGLAVEGLYRDVALTVPETTSTLSTGGVGAGLASIAWPGPILGNLGTTVLVLSNQAPPQVTALNDPVRAEARSGGTRKSTYTGLPGTVLAATATNDTVTASSRTGTQQLPVGTVGAFSAATKTAFTSATEARGTADSLVQDVSLAGGEIRIGSVTSTARARTDGLRADGTGSTTVAGMTVAGIPVRVDDKGLHVGPASAPLATEALTDAVASLGLTAVLTESRVTRSPGAVSVNAGALVVMYEQGGSTYAFTIGRAAVGLTASRSGPAGGIGLPPVAAGTAPAGSAGPAGAGSTPLGSPGTQGISPAAPAQQPSVVETVQAAAVALSHGAPGLATAGLLLLGGLLVLGLRRLPDLVLAAGGPDCDEGAA